MKKINDSRSTFELDEFEEIRSTYNLMIDTKFKIKNRVSIEIRRLSMSGKKRLFTHFRTEVFSSMKDDINTNSDPHDAKKSKMAVNSNEVNLFFALGNKVHLRS